MKWKFLVLLAFCLTKINGEEARCTANENALNNTSSNASTICATPRDGVGDDRTFPSRCALATYNCRNKNKPYIYRHEGTCNVDPRNPCKHICLQDKLVCGGPVSDQGPNMTFASVCDLQNYNCDHRDSKYRLVFEGRCEDADCPKLCGSEQNVLCAGPKRGPGQIKSFQNPCSLENYNCENRSNEYKLIYFGSCSSRPGPCRTCTNERNLICAKSYLNISRTFVNRCELERFNCEHHTNYVYQHDQRCSQHCESCPESNDAVCAFSTKSGTPLRTFKSICFLRQHNCREDSSGSGDFYEYLKNGDCQGPPSANRICRQSTCPLTSRPICASSSGNPNKRKTFLNLCELENHNCEFYNDVYYYTSDGVCEVRHPDPIPTCRIQSCSRASVLEPEICATPRDRFGPSQTFSGECELQRHNCRYPSNQYIVSHIGPCRKSENIIQCKKICDNQQSPICATSDDFKSKMTFSSVCEMENYNCDYKTFGTFRVLYTGECQTANIPSLPLFNCRYNCSSTYEPVCATSLWGLRMQRTFYNRCHFDRHNCESFLFKYEGLHAGECVSDSPRPPIFEDKCRQYNCSKDYSPICAKSALLAGISKTFINICAMELHNCQRESDKYELDHYGVCKLVQPYPPRIVSCIKDCDCDYRPVCAKPRNGPGPRQTFSNRCKLDNYNCENFADTHEVVHEGECGISLTPPIAPSPAGNCKRNCGCEVNPVCASPEGRPGVPITFQNRCKLDNYNCEHILNRYRFDYFGECSKFETSVIDSRLPDFQLGRFSDCYRECPDENSPICAEVKDSIGLLDLKRDFKNRCELDNHNCLFKFNKYVYLHEGQCSSTFTVNI